eukprot:366896_1
MPKRKQKRIRIKAIKRKKKNSKDKSSITTPQPQSVSHAELINLIETKSKTKEMEEKSHQTAEDTNICNTIKLRLCRHFTIPPSSITNGELCSQIFTRLNNLSTLYEDLGLSSEFDLNKLVSSLQSKFGLGSFVRFALSPKHLFNGHLNIPITYKLLIDKDCIFRNVAFVPHNILKILGLTCTSYDEKTQYPYIIIIYDSPQNMVNFVYYESVLFFRIKQFKQFLQKEKWNSNTLRSKLPEFAQYFSSQNMNQLMQLCQNCVEFDKMTSLRSFTNFWVPQNLALFVDDKKQKQEIEIIVNDVYKQCEDEANKMKYQSITHSKPLQNVPAENILTTVASHFPFIGNALKSIPNIIGMDEFANIARYNLEKDSNFAAATKLYKLTKRIEGRNCSYCNTKEIRSDNINEQFNKCRGCQSAIYCSKKCQKRHWNKTHRLTCKKEQS